MRGSVVLSDRSRALLLALVDAWRADPAHGPRRPVAFLRGPVGEHPAWPAAVRPMTREESRVLVLQGLAAAENPASDVSVVRPTAEGQALADRISGRVPAAAPEELPAPVGRLLDGVAARIDDEPDAERRARLRAALELVRPVVADVAGALVDEAARGAARP
jgi:hypothetical protein